MISAFCWILYNLAFWCMRLWPKHLVLRLNWKCRCAYLIYILWLTFVHKYSSRGACSLTGTYVPKSAIIRYIDYLPSAPLCDMTFLTYSRSHRKVHFSHDSIKHTYMKDDENLYPNDRVQQHEHMYACILISLSLVSAQSIWLSNSLVQNISHL